MRSLMRWGASLIAAIAVAAGLLVPAASASASTSTATASYTLELISLTCNKKQELVNKDRIFLNVNGNREFGVVKFGKGDFVSLVGTNITFTGVATMELFEEDSGLAGADDFLGSIAVNGSTLKGAGIQVGVFNALSGAKYTIEYEVT